MYGMERLACGPGGMLLPLASHAGGAPTAADRVAARVETNLARRVQADDAATLLLCGLGQRERLIQRGVAALFV